jgi:hypothetical protein
MRPVFIVLFCLGIFNSKPIYKQNISWNECLDECQYNYEINSDTAAFAAFLVPQLGAWLTLRNQSFLSMMMEGSMAIDRYRNSNDFTLCLSQCDIFYDRDRPMDPLFDEVLEKVQDNVKYLEKGIEEITLLARKNDVSAQLKFFGSQRGGLTSKNFDEAIEQVEAAFQAGTLPKEDEEGEEL